MCLQARALLSGANTADIITTYINTIRALRILDPSGVVLQVCAHGFFCVCDSSALHLFDLWAFFQIIMVCVYVALCSGRG